MTEYTLLRILMMSAAGTLLTVLLLLIKPLTTRLFSARWHYYTNVAALLVFLLPLSISFAEKKPVYNAAENIKNTFLIIYTETKVPLREMNVPQKLPSDISDVIIYAYIICVAVYILFSVLSYSLYSFRLKRTATPFAVPKTEHTNMKVFKSPAVSSPMLLGFFRGKLFLPERDFKTSEFENILCHEHIHFKRYDIAVKWLCLISRALHLFNPFIFMLSKNIALWCEISCDESATRFMDKDGKKSYCETILSLISANKKEHRLAIGVGGTKRNLERRFKSIMKEKNTAKKTAEISVIITVFILLATLTASAFLGGWVEKQNDKNAINTNTPLTAKDNLTDVSDTEIEVLDVDITASKNTEKDPVIKYFVVNEGMQYKLIPDKDNTNNAAEISAPYDESRHPAVDFKLEAGTVVTSPLEGYVTTAEYSYDKGNHIEIQSIDKSTSILFAHLDKMYVSNGDKVSFGDKIGTVGTTGMSTGPHLHVECSENGEGKNPINFVFVERDGTIRALYSVPEQITE